MEEHERTIIISRARLVATPRGVEVRCREHGHLMGVFITDDILELKCGRAELVRLEVIAADQTARSGNNVHE